MTTYRTKHFEIIEDYFITQSIELSDKKVNNIVSTSISEYSSNDKFLRKGFIVTSRSFLKKNVIDYLRFTTLLLKNQDSLLEILLSKKVYDIIDHVKLKKTSVNEFATHSTSCKSKYMLVENVKNISRSIKKTGTSFVRNHLLNLSHFLMLILELI